MFLFPFNIFSYVGNHKIPEKKWKEKYAAEEDPERKFYVVGLVRCYDSSMSLFRTVYWENTMAGQLGAGSAWSPRGYLFIKSSKF